MYVGSLGELIAWRLAGLHGPNCHVATGGVEHRTRKSKILQGMTSQCTGIFEYVQRGTYHTNRYSLLLYHVLAQMKGDIDSGGGCGSCGISTIHHTKATFLPSVTQMTNMPGVVFPFSHPSFLQAFRPTP